MFTICASLLPIPIFGFAKNKLEASFLFFSKSEYKKIDSGTLISDSIKRLYASYLFTNFEYISELQKSICLKSFLLLSS